MLDVHNVLRALTMVALLVFGCSWQTPTSPPVEVPDDPDFPKLGPPRPGEWLYHFDEARAAGRAHPRRDHGRRPVFRCVMCGANSLAESDRQPMYACPIDLKKLQWNLGFDVKQRYRKLEKIYRDNGLTQEAEWTARQLKKGS